MLSLHRDEARHAYFATHRDKEPFFEDALGCWIVTDPRQSEALLRLPALRAVAYGAAYEALAGRRELSFPNLQFAFQHIPFSLDGEAHRTARRRIADLLGRRRAAVAAAIPAIVDEFAGVLEQDGEVEIMTTVVGPIVIATLGVLTETDVADRAAFQSASIIFDRMIGLNKRLQLEADMGAIRTIIRRSANADLDEDEEGARLICFVLGQDSLQGTIGESLYRIIKAYLGARLCDIPYPRMPTETGVPYIERAVAEDFAFEGTNFRAGQRVRFLFQPIAYASHPADAMRMFGFGLHVCLGKQLALELWEQVIRRLARIGKRATVIDYAPRTADYVFTCPQRLVMSIAP